MPKSIKAECDHCGGDNIHQQANIMLPINDFAGPIRSYEKFLDDLMWDDYYYCKDCSDECHPVFDGEDDGTFGATEVCMDKYKQAHSPKEAKDE
jgi:hypothetical protein